MTKPTYNFDEACAYLNISAGSLSDLIATGELPAAKISKNWVFRQTDLDCYLAEEVRRQTEQRREAFKLGRVLRIDTAVGQVRAGRRKVPPELPRAA